MGQKSQPQSDRPRTGSRKADLYLSRMLITLQKTREKTSSPLKLNNTKDKTPTHSG